MVACGGRGHFVMVILTQNVSSLLQHEQESTPFLTISYMLDLDWIMVSHKQNEKIILPFGGLVGVLFILCLSSCF